MFSKDPGFTENTKIVKTVKPRLFRNGRVTNKTHADVNVKLTIKAIQRQFGN